MSVYNLKVTYKQQPSDGSFGTRATYSGYGFDMESKTIVGVNGTWVGSMLDKVPADVDYDPASVFFWECAEDPASNDYAAVLYYHVRATKAGQYGTYRTETQAESNYCGYVPPPPSCELVAGPAEVVGTTATLPTSGGRGALQYYLDGRTAGQSSNVFNGLTPGEHHVRVVDSGLSGCEQTVSFTVADPAPAPPPPAERAESLHYALRPIWEQVTSYAAATLVRLELWVESAHLLGDYQLVYAAQKVVPVGGEVSFRLDGVLLDLLAPEPPDLGAVATTRLQKSIRNYFCRTAPVTAAGEVGLLSNRPVRTVLLAGLPLPAAFLTTQPERKRIVQGQPEYLDFITPPSQATAGAVGVRRVLVGTDGTRQQLEEPVALPEAANYRLLRVRVQAGALPPTVQRVEVSLVDAQGNALSETRTYELVQPTAVRRTFLFASPAGGVDTLVCTGQSVATLDVKTDLAGRGPAPDDAPTAALQQVWQLSPERKRRVATGWQTPAQLRWLQCFALHRQAWEVVGTQLVPIVVSKRSVSYGRDERRPEGLVFEYELAAEAAAWEELRA